MAVLYVKPTVEAGLNRGGEDLSLSFACEVEGETVPTEFDTQLATDAEDDLDGVNVGLLDDEEAERVAETGGPYRGRLKYTTHHYEVEWEGTAVDAFLLMVDHLKDNQNWRFCHRPGESPKLRFTYQHYVGGNAD